ncbi:MAG: glycosyltransferase, partial [Alphaproteobacteria bacterium]
MIPAYDAERYLEACLTDLDRSLVRPLEVIVVDDGSTDRTAAI